MPSPTTVFSDTQILDVSSAEVSSGLARRRLNVRLPNRLIVKNKSDFQYRRDGLPSRRMDVSEMQYDSDIQQARVRSDSPALALTLPQNLLPHLLLASLLEDMCYIYVKDRSKAQQLFRILCEQLSQLQVMTPLSHLDEMCGLRYQRRTMLNNLIQAAIRSMEQRPSLLALHDLNGGLNVDGPVKLEEDIILLQPSRYRNEFQELGLLGKGGFGSVFKARNYLDGREYAVKKVRFRNNNTDLELKLLREVKALANLAHSHIVGYNAAWMEYDGPDFQAKEQDLHNNVKSQNSISESFNSVNAVSQDSMSIEFCVTDDQNKSSPESSVQPLPGQAGLAMNAKLFSKIPANYAVSNDQTTAPVSSAQTHLNQNHNSCSEHVAHHPVQGLSHTVSCLKSLGTQDKICENGLDNDGNICSVTLNNAPCNLTLNDCDARNITTSHIQDHSLDVSKLLDNQSSTLSFKKGVADVSSTDSALDATYQPVNHDLIFDTSFQPTNHNLIPAHIHSQLVECHGTHYSEIDSENCVCKSPGRRDQSLQIQTPDRSHHITMVGTASPQKTVDPLISSNQQHSPTSLPHLYHSSHSYGSNSSSTCNLISSLDEQKTNQISHFDSQSLNYSEKLTPVQCPSCLPSSFKKINHLQSHESLAVDSVKSGTILTSILNKKLTAAPISGTKSNWQTMMSGVGATYDDESGPSLPLVCAAHNWSPAWVSSVLPETSKRPITAENITQSQEQTIFQNSVTLYIQMELCTFTLQEWMSERNSECHLKGCDDAVMHSDNIRIFHQILQGVDYIHTRGLIHRDLKPRNIFLSGSDLHVKIGDFGLATSDALKLGPKNLMLSPASVDAALNVDNHTTGVGTSAYASPEQLRGSNYDFKSDMYSLGVMMYELFQIFSTEMERVREIQKLRGSSKCCDAFIQKWPLEADTVEALVNPVASLRPSAQEVLCSHLFLSLEQQVKLLQKQLNTQKIQLESLSTEKNSIIEQLQQDNIQKDSIIAQLQRENIQKDSIIAQLQRDNIQKDIIIAQLQTDSMQKDFITA